MESHVAMRCATAFFAFVLAYYFFPWFCFKVCILFGLFIMVYVASCYAPSAEDMPTIEDFYTDIELPAIHIPLQLEMIGRAFLDLVILLWTVAVWLASTLWQLGCWLYKLSQYQKHEPSACWDRMVIIHSDPTVLEALPSPPLRQLPRPKMTDEEEAAHILAVRQSEQLICYTSQEPVRLTAAQRKAQSAQQNAINDGIDRQRAAAKEKEQQEFQKKYGPYLPPQFTPEEQARLLGDLQVLLRADDERRRKEQRFSLLQQSRTAFSGSWTSAARHAKFEKTREWIEENLRRQQNTKGSSTANGGSNGTEMPQGRPQDDPYSGRRTEIMFKLEMAMKKFFQYLDPNAADPAATTPAVNEGNLYDSFEEFADFIRDFLEWVAPNMVWDTSKVSLEAAITMHMGPADPGLWVLLEKIMILERRVPHCMQIRNAAAVLERLRTACGAPSINTNAPHTAQPTNTLPTTQPTTAASTGSAPGVGSAPDDKPPPPHSAADIEKKRAEVKQTLQHYIDCFFTVRANSEPWKSTSPPMDKESFERKCKAFCDALKEIYEWLHPGDILHWDTTKMDSSAVDECYMGAKTESKLWHVETKLKNAHKKTRSCSELGSSLEEMRNLHDSWRAAFPPPSKTNGPARSNAQGGGNRSGSSARNGTAPGSSRAAAPQKNEIPSKPNDAAKRAVIGTWATQMLSNLGTLQSVRNSSCDSLTKELKTTAERLQWITEWCAPDQLTWDTTRINQSQAKGLRMTSEDLKKTEKIIAEMKRDPRTMDVEVINDADRKIGHLVIICPF